MIDFYINIYRVIYPIEGGVFVTGPARKASKMKWFYNTIVSKIPQVYQFGNYDTCQRRNFHADYNILYMDNAKFLSKCFGVKGN